MENGTFFKCITPETLGDNVFKMIGADWMLITAGDKTAFNTMTASWGGLGILWHKPVVYCFVRPSRYTYEFMEKGHIFSLSFFPDGHRDALNILGSKSGRDGDKIRETGLTPVTLEQGAVSFKEARLVLVCRKLYHQDLNPENFPDEGVSAFYPGKDFHRMYIGEIISTLTR